MCARLSFPSRVDSKAPVNSPLLPCDPEDRSVVGDDLEAIREKMFDKTLADSYPASDPPSTLPNPSADSMCRIACEDLPVRRAA